MTKLRATCGCGFASPSLLEASKHAEETGHLLTVTGTIRPDAEPTAVRSFNRLKDELVQKRLNEQMWEEHERRSGEETPRW